MKLEDQLHEDLHRTSMSAGLLPPADLADTVLHSLRRQRRNRVLVAAVGAAVAMVAAVGLPLALPQILGGGGTQPAGPPFPAAEFPVPGGGDQVIHSYTSEYFAGESRSYLLDVATGEYREFPYDHIVLSPDRTMAAFDAGDRIGVADREKLLADGESAARWVDFAPGNGLLWSPDGSALLHTALYKGDSTVSFAAQRYDLDTREITTTPIDVRIAGGSVGWAADSRRYLALLPGPGGSLGNLQYIEPDGRLGELVEITGGMVGGADAYSPSREYLLVDPSGLMVDHSIPTKVVEAGTGEVAAELPGRRPTPVGWYDEDTVVLLHYAAGDVDYGVLELVDVETGEVVKEVELPGLLYPRAIQIGASDGLTGDAEAYGF